MLRWLVGILIVTTTLATQAADNLRIATFNINWGDVNLPDIQRAITEADAEVICFQESTEDSEKYLRKGFSVTYPHIAFAGHLGRYREERFGFLSKKPLSDVQYTPPAHGLFGTYFATVAYQGQAVKIVNIHLSPFIIRRGSSIRQAFQAVSSAEAVHKKEIDAVCTQIDPSHATLVCGDFNSFSSLAAPTQLVELGLVDSFAAVTKNPDSHPTWRWSVGKSQIKFRIDYVFHTSHFSTVSSDVIATKGSDHSLLVSELSIKP